MCLCHLGLSVTRRSSQGWYNQIEFVCCTSRAGDRYLCPSFLLICWRRCLFEVPSEISIFFHLPESKDLQAKGYQGRETQAWPDATAMEHNTNHCFLGIVWFGWDKTANCIDSQGHWETDLGTSLWSDSTSDLHRQRTGWVAAPCRDVCFQMIPLPRAASVCAVISTDKVWHTGNHPFPLQVCWEQEGFQHFKLELRIIWLLLKQVFSTAGRLILWWCNKSHIPWVCL